MICYCKAMFICSSDINWNTASFSFSDGPEIVPSMEPSVAQINKSISIPCGASVTGNPPPLVTWGYHNGQSIPGDSRFTVRASGHLLLLLASYGDAGLYDCTASNVAGESSVTINLLVLGMLHIEYCWKFNNH